jgi:hypothetical protein
MTRGFTHESGVSKTREWYTPPYIFEALGLDFDLDAASPEQPVPWVPASKHLSVEDDGLSAPWCGRVWLNPPYGKRLPEWTARMCAHGDGVLHTYARTDVGWFQDHVMRADAVCFIRGRVRSYTTDYQLGGTPGAGHILAGYGLECGLAVWQCGLGFCVRP